MGKGALWYDGAGQLLISGVPDYEYFEQVPYAE